MCWSGADSCVFDHDMCVLSAQLASAAAAGGWAHTRRRVVLDSRCIEIGSEGSNRLRMCPRLLQSRVARNGRCDVDVWTCSIESVRSKLIVTICLHFHKYTTHISLSGTHTDTVREGQMRGIVCAGSVLIRACLTMICVFSPLSIG